MTMSKPDRSEIKTKEVKKKKNSGYCFKENLGGKKLQEMNQRKFGLRSAQGLREGFW